MMKKTGGYKKKEISVRCRLGLHLWSQIPPEISGNFSREADGICKKCSTIHMNGAFGRRPLPKYNNI